MAHAQIASLIPTIQAAALVNANVKQLKKKKAKSKDFIEMGIGNIVGIELLRVNASLVSTL